MEALRINNEDTVQHIAKVIYEQFELLQSCTIKGFVIDRELVEPKGKYVVEELKELDRRDNINNPKGDKRPRRKRVILPDSIGGYVAQKIFKFKHDMRDGMPITTIWRAQ